MQLHKRDVVAKAAAILDGYGIADLTMRRLARELDVTPGALYWHFANKQELLGAVADHVLAPACAEPASAGWRERIETVCRGLRDALLSHTDGAELVSASFAAGQSRAVEQILGVLAEAAGEAGVDARAPDPGRPHGAALRARGDRRRAIPVAVGRGRSRTAATNNPCSAPTSAAGSTSGYSCWSTESLRNGRCRCDHRRPGAADRACAATGLRDDCSRPDHVSRRQAGLPRNSPATRR